MIHPNPRYHYFSKSFQPPPAATGGLFFLRIIISYRLTRRRADCITPNSHKPNFTVISENFDFENENAHKQGLPLILKSMGCVHFDFTLCLWYNAVNLRRSSMTTAKRFPMLLFRSGWPQATNLNFIFLRRV